jgi:hypothetical protein
VKGLFAPSCRASVQTFRLALVGPTLGLGNPLLDTAVKMPRLKFLAIARGHGIFEPQIKSYRRFGGCTLLDFTGHGQTQPPIADRVLRKATGFPSFALQQSSFEHPDRFAAKAQPFTLLFQLHGLKGYPPQGSFSSSADPPAQLYPFELLSARSKLGIHPLYGVRANVLEEFGGPSGQFV